MRSRLLIFCFILALTAHYYTTQIVSPDSFIKGEKDQNALKAQIVFFLNSSYWTIANALDQQTAADSRERYQGIWGQKD